TLDLTLIPRSQCRTANDNRPLLSYPEDGFGRAFPSTAAVPATSGWDALSDPLQDPHKQSKFQCSSRVELKFFRQWGTVCVNWDTQDAAVICKMFGCGGFHGAVGSAHFWMGKGPVWLDSLQCSGSEASVLECPRENLRKHNCDNNEDAGIICSDVDVHLINGPDCCSDRVEIHLSGIWEMVCGDSWDMRGANILVNQLTLGEAKILSSWRTCSALDQRPPFWTVTTVACCHTAVTTIKMLQSYALVRYSVHTASNRFLRLRQGNRSVAEYTFKFRTLAKQGGWRSASLL
ncbi:hypothetical protein Z043_125454, partial [Scleropages formosus]